MQIAQVLGRHRRRRALEQRPRRGGLGESDDITKRRRPRELHGDAVKPQRNTAVRGRPALQSIEQESKSRSRRILIDPKQLKNTGLQIRTGDTNATAAELGAIVNDVVGLRPNALRRGVEELNVV